MSAGKRVHSVSFGTVAGEEFLKFADLYSFDATDGSRIKSQYAAELSCAGQGVGALGVRACGDLIAAASYGTVRLPRPGAVSARIDVVVTTPVCRGRGLARATIGALLQNFIDTYGVRLEHVSVVAVHPTIKRIAESLGFADANVGTSSPVLHRTVLGQQQVALRVAAEQAQTTACQSLRSECARCMWGKQRPWCGRTEPVRGS